MYCPLKWKRRRNTHTRINETPIVIEEENLLTPSSTTHIQQQLDNSAIELSNLKRALSTLNSQKALQYK